MDIFTELPCKKRPTGCLPMHWPLSLLPVSCGAQTQLTPCKVFRTSAKPQRMTLTFYLRSFALEVLLAAHCCQCSITPFSNCIFLNEMFTWTVKSDLLFSHAVCVKGCHSQWNLFQVSFLGCVFVYDLQMCRNDHLWADEQVQSPAEGHQHTGVCWK